MLSTTDDFKKIVVEETPLIDVRAPIEFANGAFINAVNLPIMNDEERRLVGICYKEQGNEMATKLGHELVSGAVKDERIAAWKAQLERDPKTLIYCFRGGQRSGISQRWIYEATGREVPRLAGGYKAFRQFLIDNLAPEAQTSQPILLGGCTGSGKTLLLNGIENFVDLEGLANHRGSSFGAHVHAQPTQIQFENDLAYRLIQHREAGHKHLILEDEGSHVGRCYLPKPLAAFFGSGELVLLDVTLEERVEITSDEYVVEAQKRYDQVFGQDKGHGEWAKQILGNLERIKNRLGGDRYKQIVLLFEEADRLQLSTGSTDAHKSWVEVLLTQYYDPMYLYQIEKRKDTIVFRGNAQAVKAYLLERSKDERR